jgi:uncharacterized repeat protein (TIGR01451 family)
LNDEPNKEDEVMTRVITITVCVLMLAGVAQAAVELEAVAMTEVTTTNEAGQEVTTRMEAGKVVPGDEVIYTITFANRGTEPAADVVITNPIPDHMVFTQVEDSPQGANVSMSADGGALYGAPRSLTITDAKGIKRPAKASDFTHVRWTFQNPLEPGAEGSVSFKAQLQ